MLITISVLFIALSLIFYAIGGARLLYYRKAKKPTDPNFDISISLFYGGIEGFKRKMLFWGSLGTACLSIGVALMVYIF